MIKAWFDNRPERLKAFALWVAARASSRKGKTIGPAAELFRAARALLGGLRPWEAPAKIDRLAAHELHARLRAFQNEYENQPWGPVRVIHNWNLMVVETGLALFLDSVPSPAAGYKLAADYCQHDDPQHGSCLSGPSATKLQEIVRFLFTIEGLEEVTA